ncbi:MAG: FUSC family protein [Humibacillus sp.]|nr:FUSC family protein [Humibacillus sp.]MDN5777017.1 FUSC family protein [Humibacillus sp.]
MVIVAPLLGAAGGLGAYTAYGWGWAALLAVTGLVAGAGYGFGWFAALLMVPFAATFISPVSTVGDAVTYAVILAISTLYGVIGARKMGVPATVEGRRISAPEACAVAVLFGAILGGAAAIGVSLGWTEPYWVPEPVLVLVLYVMIGKRDRIRGKAIGTAAGAAAALPVALIDPPAAVLTLVGIVALLLAFTQTKVYWLMYGLYTFAVVLLLAAPGQVAFEAEERGLQILLGVGLLAIGLFVLEAMRKWLGERASGLPQTPA